MTDDPTLHLSAVFGRGATFSRTYNTGDFDATDYTPRPSLLKRRDGAVVGTIRMARLTLPDGSADNRNFAFVVSRDVTSQLDPSSQYVGNIDFDNHVDGVSTVRHAIVAITVGMGDAR